MHHRRRGDDDDDDDELGGRAPVHGPLQRPVPRPDLRPARVRCSAPRRRWCRHRLSQGAVLHVRASYNCSICASIHGSVRVVLPGVG